MITVTGSVQIDESDIQFEFIRASGPDGQNVNKVATAVQLRFNVRNTQSMVTDVKERLIKMAGNRMTDDGILLIEAKRYRSQEQNRLDAMQRLNALILKALEKPKLRKATRPSKTAKAARVDDKKKRSDIKRERKFTPKEWE